MMLIKLTSIIQSFTMVHLPYCTAVTTNVISLNSSNWSTPFEAVEVGNSDTLSKLTKSHCSVHTNQLR